MILDIIGNFIEYNDFLHPGFWGMALIAGLAPLSLFAHLVISIWVTIKKKSFTTKSIFESSLLFLFGLLGLLIIIYLFDYSIGNEAYYKKEEVVGLMPMFFWLFYFIFIPQLLANWLVNKLGQGLERKNQKAALFFLRFVLLILITVGMIILHVYLGELMSITSD